MEFVNSLNADTRKELLGGGTKHGHHQHSSGSLGLLEDSLTGSSTSTTTRRMMARSSSATSASHMSTNQLMESTAATSSTTSSTSQGPMRNVDSASSLSSTVYEEEDVMAGSNQVTDDDDEDQQGLHQHQHHRPGSAPPNLDFEASSLFRFGATGTTSSFFASMHNYEEDSLMGGDNEETTFGASSSGSSSSVAMPVPVPTVVTASSSRSSAVGGSTSRHGTSASQAVARSSGNASSSRVTVMSSIPGRRKNSIEMFLSQSPSQALGGDFLKLNLEDRRHSRHGGRATKSGNGGGGNNNGLDGDLHEDDAMAFGRGGLKRSDDGDNNNYEPPTPFALGSRYDDAESAWNTDMTGRNSSGSSTSGSAGGSAGVPPAASGGFYSEPTMSRQPEEFGYYDYATSYDTLNRSSGLAHHGLQQQHQMPSGHHASNQQSHSSMFRSTYGSSGAGASGMTSLGNMRGAGSAGGWNAQSTPMVVPPRPPLGPYDHLSNASAGSYAHMGPSQSQLAYQNVSRMMVNNQRRNMYDSRLSNLSPPPPPLPEMSPPPLSPRKSAMLMGSSNNNVGMNVGGGMMSNLPKHCKFFLQGHCRMGNKCKFIHHGGAGASSGMYGANAGVSSMLGQDMMGTAGAGVGTGVNMGLTGPMPPPPQPRGMSYRVMDGSSGASGPGANSPRLNQLDTSSLSTTLAVEDIVGRVFAMSKDQNGCRLLQEQLDYEDRRDLCDLIYQESLDHLAEMMVDPFGNYLFQKLLERVSFQQRGVIIKRVSFNLVAAALNLHGTRSVQKVVEVCAMPGAFTEPIDDFEQDEVVEEVRDLDGASSTNSTSGGTESPRHRSRPRVLADIIVEALRDDAVRLCIDSNGNHVIQRALQYLKPEYNQFVFDAVCKECTTVGTHRHGCCVLQRCLDAANKQQKREVIAQVEKQAMKLMQDPYGNYVVQYVLDSCTAEEAYGVIIKPLGHIYELSIQKFSSNVIEKCLEKAPERIRQKYIKEITLCPKMNKMLQDQFANYVVQRALCVCSEEQCVMLVNAIRPHLACMKNTSGGRRITARILKRFPSMDMNLEMHTGNPPMPGGGTVGVAGSSGMTGGFGAFEQATSGASGASGSAPFGMMVGLHPLGSFSSSRSMPNHGVGTPTGSPPPTAAGTSRA